MTHPNPERRPMSDDLVKRLRRTGAFHGFVNTNAAGCASVAANWEERREKRPINPDGPAAAARIEAQEREIERLREALRDFVEAADRWAAVAGSGSREASELGDAHERARKVLAPETAQSVAQPLKGK